MTQPAYEIQRHVEFYETDMAGIVHFSNFFRYMEICEHAFVRSLDHELQGRSPARFGDLLSIRLFITEVRNRSVRYRFEITRQETLIAEGSISAAHVAITPDGFKAVPLPPALAEKLSALVTAS